MNKKYISIATAVLIFGAAAFNITIANETPAEPIAEEIKSVAYYVANTKEAREKNRECYEQGNMQANQNCANSLHALQISFVGGDRISGYKYSDR